MKALKLSEITREGSVGRKGHVEIGEMGNQQRRLKRVASELGRKPGWSGAWEVK